MAYELMPKTKRCIITLYYQRNMPLVLAIPLLIVHKPLQKGAKGLRLKKMLQICKSKSRILTCSRPKLLSQFVSSSYVL